ncbi:DNA primase [Melghiribacillus thermohalophilus]|uniref:DNA primase n=1 Tax=Melghiribacillus thermohalophilus TaxID=1324956 RepID=A0A4R3NBL0_9BACI|nr:DNA primase [Melghiribacillus thermohalophilus]TCT27007.1 DNA primase [Melghiribacillus thermohalophilus]
MPDQSREQFIEEIRAANDIVDVVGEYVQLKKQGRNYFGLCPFHSENTPSFSVSPEKQIFHCFGCGKGGNVVTFVMEMEGISFREAISLLAEKSGRSLPDSFRTEKPSPASQEAQNILEAHQWLTKLYHHLLKHTKEGREALQYLEQRGLSEETIDAFQIGYAPDAKHFVVSFLEKKGFHPQTMVKAGLLSVTDENKYIDRFRGRVIFPIRNHQGKTVAFSARTLSDQKPKYINSPETEIFHKGRMLFNFDLARPHIRKMSEAVLVEGAFDAIASYQAGVQNVIATLGTALTDFQASLLRRYVDTVIICYDADSAGLEATIKAASLLKKVGCYVKIARMEQGMDPDDYIQTYGSESFQKHVIQGNITYMSFYLKYLRKQFNLQTEADRIRYIEKALDQISTVDKPVEREHYVKDLADEFELSRETLHQEIRYRRRKMGKYKDKQQAERHNKSNPMTKPSEKLLPAFHNAERYLLAYMLKDPEIADFVQEKLGGAFLINEHQVMVTYLYAFYEEDHRADISRFMEYLPDEQLRNLTAQIALLPVSDVTSNREIEDYVNVIKKEKHRRELHQLEMELKEAERQNNPVKAAQIAMEVLELKKQWKQEKNK